MHKEHSLLVDVDSVGDRLDKFILKSVPDLSRTRIQKLIEDNLILINSEKVKSGYKLKKSDKVSVSIPELEEIALKPEKIKLDIVYEDKDLIVINKPTGMVTHPGSGITEGTLVNALLHHCKSTLSGINGVQRPGIVHRLDKETSGLIIVCKNDKSHTGVAEQFHNRTIEKYYYAIVHGNMKFTIGKINRPIGRDKVKRHKMAIIKDGKPAITHWNVIKSDQNYTFIECKLETGRTHQIRVHMASIGYPIVGDKTYGKKSDKSSHMMLHSYKIIFTHPISKKKIKLETEIPERFSNIIS